MTTENLISQLSKNVGPVKPLPPTWRRTFNLLVTMLVGSGLVFVLFSIRHNLHEAFFTAQFLIGFLILIMSWFVATYSLSISQLPTRDNKKHLIVGFILVLVLTFVYLVNGLLSPSESFQEGFAFGGVKCSLDILFLSLLPIIALTFILRKSAPTNYLLSGLNMALCCGALGAFLLQFSCPSEDPAHLLLWHLFVPITALGGAGLILSRKYLKW
jgi:hypothetical protein